MLNYQMNSSREIEDESLKKKKQIRKLSQDCEEENKLIEENHKKLILKEKEEDKEYMLSYSKMLNEEEEKRKLEKQFILNKVKSFTSESFYSKFIDINELNKRNMQNKIQNNLSFTERTMLLNEQKLKNKAIQVINETQNILRSQIDIKKEEKLKASMSKIEEKNNLDQYIYRQDADNKKKLTKRMLTFKDYKKSLEEEIKNKKKEQFMTEEERKINKDYI